jgi:hypothetical protein
MCRTYWDPQCGVRLERGLVLKIRPGDGKGDSAFQFRSFSQRIIVLANIH